MRHVPIAPDPVRYAIAFVCAAVILYGSILEPSDSVPRTVLGVGFTVYMHLIAYGGFTVAIGYAFLSADWRALVLAASIAIVYGGAIELLQGQLPYRTMSAMDALINAVGACIGAVLWRTVAPSFGAGRNDETAATN